MNILFLADAVFADKPGGSRTAARETAKCLVDRGHKVVFLVNQVKVGTPLLENDGGLITIRVPQTRVPPLGMARACERAVADHGPFDIVHTHFAYQAFGPLALTKALRGVPHIRTFHGPWCEEGWVEDTARPGGAAGRLKAQAKRIFRHAIERDNLNRSQSITVLSDFMKAELTGHFGLSGDRIKKIEGGSDTQRFVIPADRAAIRARLGWPADKAVLFTVRRLAARMGLENLIRAFKDVLAVRPNTLLVIGGRGPERERLENLARELGISESVRFAGFIADSELADYYGAADLFVLPTAALEGFGLVITESLATGTPVLGTPVGAIPEILGPLHSNFLTRDATAPAIADGLISFLTGGWAAPFTRERLRGYVLDNYTWKRSALLLESVYREHLTDHESETASAAH